MFDVVELNVAELTRYSRHLLMPEIGHVGQARLKRSRVLIVGLGGLGCPAAVYLASAGVGTIGLADFDVVDASNLQRQILYGVQDVGSLKVQCAARQLNAINDCIGIVQHCLRVGAENAAELISDYDLVLDATDNLACKYLLNDACFLQGKPYIYGAIYRLEGQCTSFLPGRGCFRCLFPDPEATSLPGCAEIGVLSALPGLVGIIQATEAIKILLELGQPLAGRLMLYDALSMKTREITYQRRTDCPLCSDQPTIKTLKEEHVQCSAGQEIDCASLRRHLQNGGKERIVLLDVRSSDEHQQVCLPGTHFIPLPELTKRLNELDKSCEIITYCHSGRRSRTAAAMLRESGFRARSLAGGIIAWLASS
jgi:adenylyltransferase/sulfurtransferase